MLNTPRAPVTAFRGILDEGRPRYMSIGALEIREKTDELAELIRRHPLTPLPEPVNGRTGEPQQPNGDLVTIGHQ